MAAWRCRYRVRPDLFNPILYRALSSVERSTKCRQHSASVACGG
jgi:hypothetical protein